MIELQQQRLHVYENKWVARPTKNRGSNEGRQAKNGGVQRSLTERLARSRLQWAGHVE